MDGQLGELGLVVNTLVLWNMRYLQQALQKHQLTEGAPEMSDVARLSLLLHEHVNMPGCYDFTLPERVAAGELRPLRDPANWQEQFAEFP